MRRILIFLVLTLLLTGSVSAVEYTAPEPPQSVEDLIPVETEDFAQGLWKIVKNAIASSRPDLKNGAGVALSIICIAILVSVLRQFYGDGSIVEIIGVVAICLILINSAGAMIRLGADTVTELSEYGKLLLPVMTAAMAASGAGVSSGALYAGTAAFDAVLSSMIAKLIVPMVYAFIVVSIVAAVTGESLIKKIKAFMKWLMTWSLKIVLYVFTGYMGITGVVSGSTDAAALKATKLTISGMVPVVGGILSDASEAVIVGAGVVKSGVGIYGLLVISAIWISPFLMIGAQYLLLKLSAAVCEAFSCKLITDAVQSFAAAMGILLAMTGAASLMLLVSTVCFMKGVG